MRGSFPAPHHHDPNKTLPNFQIWGHGGVSLGKHRRRATARSTLPSRRSAAAFSTHPDVAASLLPVVAAPVHAWIRVPTGITDHQGQAGLSWRRLATTSRALFHLPFTWCCWPCSWKYHPRSFIQSFGSSCCFKYLQGLGPLGMGFNPVQCQGIFGRSTAIRAIPGLSH